MTDQEKLRLLDLAAFLAYAVDFNLGYMWTLGNAGHDLAGLARQEEDFHPKSAGYSDRIL